MFQVSVEETFSAGHALRGYRGKCENPHGHNYRVRVNVEGPQLDSIGLLFDFAHLKRVLRELIGGVDHKFLNDQAPFDTINPSAENMAKFFYDETSEQMRPARRTPRASPASPCGRPTRRRPPTRPECRAARCAAPTLLIVLPAVIVGICYFAVFHSLGMAISWAPFAGAAVAFCRGAVARSPLSAAQSRDGHGG